MIKSSQYGIAIFHGIGDILNCTPIAKQLKINDPECHITWFTASKYRFIIENNPFIDEIITLEGDVLELDNQMSRLKESRSWKKFYTPAPYMNYDVLPGAPLLELIKTAAQLEWTFEFIPTFALTELEQQAARSYWNTLPEGKKILVETEFYSQQSHWKDDYAFEMANEFREVNPVFVFTSKNKPTFFDEFKTKYPRSVWCSEPFRLNAEFFNLSDAFIGVSSGISCVTFSDYCRRDIPRIEVSRGEHWSAAGYGHLSELYVCYHRTRFREALRALAVRLSGNNGSDQTDFSKRFAVIGVLPNHKERVPCLVCGSRQSSPVRGDDIVKCTDCGFHYLRDRMSTSAMEEYYTNVYAVDNPNAAPMVRVPPSKKAVDELPEYISSQRKELFNQAVEVYGKDILGGTLIDIGCGWGALLHNARRAGMNVVGFEFTTPNVEFGRKVLKLDIRQQQFVDSDIAENSVDIITMSHVLEHVPFPFEFLQKIEYVLKPGGIFTCVVPNFSSLCSDALHEQWSWLEREWHYSQFTPIVLREMFAQAGLFTEQCTTETGDFGKEIPLAILQQIQPNLSFQELDLTLDRINQSGLGEEIRIIGRKRGNSKTRYKSKGKNILWVRTDSIGDALLSVSMLPFVREKYPHSTITVLCQHHLREFYMACPFVDIVIDFDKDKTYNDEAYRNEIVHSLQKMNFDLALNSVYSREPLTDFFTLVVGASTTVAFDGGLDNMSKSIRLENNKQYSQIITSDVEWKSEVERHRDFLAGIDINTPMLEPKIWLTDADELFAQSFFEENNLHAEHTIGLFAGVLVDIRQYEHFGKALAPICADNNYTVVGFGTDKEYEFVQKQLDETGAKTINLCGKTTIGQLAALLKKCTIAIGSETGTAHIACSVGTRNIVLLGGGHFGRFMPYSALTSVVCLPLECYGCNWQCAYSTTYCIRSVSQDILTQAIRLSIVTSSKKPRVYVQDTNQWDSTSDTMPQWSWFFRWLKPNTVEIIRLDIPEEAKMNVHSLGNSSSVKDSSIVVTAVVSTYNSEKFIRGCLEDLIQQTLYIQGMMEILVIDSCSEQGERAIVEEFQLHNPNIRYERTAQRETLYKSWNYACTIAYGKYIANTNADDRRRSDCLEKLSSILEESGKGIAYSDLAFTTEENKPFEYALMGQWQFPDFDPKLAVLYNLGCFTLLWSKSAWESVGGFNENYTLAADFDFFTRVGLLHGSAHIAEPLTMALLHSGQQSKNEDTMTEESNLIRAEFSKLPLEVIFPDRILSTTIQRANACITMGNICLSLREPWFGEQVVIKPQTASLWYQRALEELPQYALAHFNLALLAAVVGKTEVAKQILLQIKKNISDSQLKSAEKFIKDVDKGITQKLLLSIPLSYVEVPLLQYSEDKSIIEPNTNTSLKTKILITMYGWNETGGGTTLPRSIAIRLAQMGYEIAVFYAAGRHPSNRSPYVIEEKTEHGVRLFGVYNRPTIFLDTDHPLREVEDTDCRLLFEEVLELFSPDVVHFHNFLGLSFSIADSAKRRQIPTIYTPHNYHIIDPNLYLFNSDLTLWKSTSLIDNSELVKNNPRKKSEYEYRQKKARELVSDTIDYTIAVSSRQCEIIQNFTGETRQITIVNQVPESTDILSHPRNKSYRNRPLIFGFIGGIMPHKGIHILVQAAQAFTSQEAEFHIYGFGSKEYIDFLKTIDQKGNLHFHGEYSSDDLPEITASIDAMILPSIWEDCAPLVIAESLAFGVPVIGADIGGFSDFVLDGVNGRLYNYLSFQELAAVLKEYIASPMKLKLLHKNTTLPYDFTFYVNFMSTLYEKLAKGEKLLPKDVSLHFREQLLPLNSQHTTSSMPTEPLNRIQFSQNLNGGFSNKNARASMPDTLPSPLYLNLGCGHDVRDGFVNIDLFSDDDRVVVMDIRKLQLADSLADGVLASDVLEHFSHRETDEILREWARVLKPNGEIIIRCPSLRLQVQAYQKGIWDADIASYMIYGGQTNPGDYHCIGFDERSIRKHLEQAGFEILSFEEVDTIQTTGFINLNMTVQARKKVVEEIILPIQFSKGQSEAQGNLKYSSTAKSKLQSSIEPSINLVWEGSQFVVHSLALINREQCANVIKSGVAEVTIVPFETDQFSPENNPKYKLLAEHDIRNKQPTSERVKKLPYVWVRHQWPPSFDEPKGSKWVIQQPWEFSALRKDFVELFNRADEIWTPSNYSRNAFVSSGVDFNKVQIIPNGVNPELFTPTGKHLEFSTKKRFKFLFVGGTILRKGIDILLQSFASTFSANDDVCLIIKDMGGDSFYKGQTAKAMIDQIRSMNGAPEILYADSMLSEEEMASLYRSCDVFVSPYRGEGFSLPALEAMASGLPVIVTEGGATDDFVDESVGWLIPAGKSSIGNSISGYELSSEGFLLEPDANELSEILRYAFAHPIECFHKGIHGSYRARNDWTWNRATIKMLSRLDMLCDTEMAKNAEKVLHKNYDGNSAFAQAENALSVGDIDKAIEFYQKGMTLGGLPERYLLLSLHRLAWISAADGDVELAREFVKKAGSIVRHHPDSIYLESLCYAIESKWLESLEMLNSILDNWKQYRYEVALGLELDKLLCESGRALFHLGDLENAHELYTQALKLNPENADACYGTALCFREAGIMEEARTMFEWALRLQPNYEDLRGEF